MSAKYDKYELIERIGTGGMAEVFKARLPGAFGFEKIVVVKRLLPHLARDPRMVEMFVGEAKLAAHVHHPNVVQVFELGQTGPENDFFMVMEFIDGTDFRALLKKAREKNVRIPPWFSVHVLCEVLDGLSYVHELTDKKGRPRNVVHCDVSPDNIFISRFGDVKLGDFGVAKDDMRADDAYGEHIKGKFAYMAPEQLGGKGIDRRADVFAAGVVLWECLTQTSLFRGSSTAETINNVCDMRRIPPSTLMRDIPPELDAPVLQALMADPDQRTPSARALHRELLTLLPKLRDHIGQIDIRAALEEITGGVQRTPLPGAVLTPPPIEELPEARLDSLGEYDVPLEKEESIEVSLSGIEQEEVSELTPTASRIWEPYSGKYPFWLRGPMSSDFGPCSLEDVAAIVRAKITERKEAEVEVSADRAQWMPVLRYLRMTSQDPSAPADTAAQTIAATPLRVASAISLFENILARRLTGRVQVDRTGVEIHVVEGRPTHVIARDPRFEMAGLLLSNHIVTEDELEECFHTVVREDRTLRQVVYEKTGTDIEEYWLPFMRQRLQPLFEHEIRSCTFLPIPPEYTKPFADSLTVFVSPQEAVSH